MVPEALKRWAAGLAWLVVLVLLVLLVVNRTHIVVKFSLKSLKRKRNKKQTTLG